MPALIPEEYDRIRDVVLRLGDEARIFSLKDAILAFTSLGFFEQGFNVTFENHEDIDELLQDMLELGYLREIETGGGARRWQIVSEVPR